MRRLITILATALLVTASLAALLVNARPRTPTPGPTQTPSPTPPPIVLSSMIPGDVNVTAQTVSIDAFQPDFDVYSWNTFIALNWPAGPDGNADPSQKIGQNGDNDTVWEHYRDVSDIFLPGGAKPTWNGPAPIPDACKSLKKSNLEVVTQ